MKVQFYALYVIQESQTDFFCYYFLFRRVMTGFTRIVTHAGPFHCDEVSSQSEGSIMTVDQSEASMHRDQETLKDLQVLLY